MKLSVETKVAAAVAAAFAVLTVGVIAQGNSEDEITGANQYRPANEAYIIQQAYHSSLPAPLRTEERETQRFAVHDDSAQWFGSDAALTKYGRGNTRVITKQ